MSEAGPIILGNWKMNGLRAEGQALVRDLLLGLDDCQGPGTIGVCPPATILQAMSLLVDRTIVRLGGQDCAAADSGAYTGDISAAMLIDAGCRFTLIGHSERRHGHGEYDALVCAKANMAIGAGLDVVLCIGETEADHEAGRTMAILDQQLEQGMPDKAHAGNLVIAYEPVWAIGTGKTPTIDDIAATHRHLRDKMASLLPSGRDVPLLYGGSVKASNAGEILGIDQVNGALVGGASLKADEFLAIWRAGQKAKAR